MKSMMVLKLLKNSSKNKIPKRDFFYLKYFCIIVDMNLTFKKNGVIHEPINHWELTDGNYLVMYQGSRGMNPELDFIIKYKTHKSRLRAPSHTQWIVDLIVKILIILAGIIVCFLIIAAIPIFGSWAIPVAAVNIAIMIAILIPTIMIKVFMDDIMNLEKFVSPNLSKKLQEISSNKYIRIT